MPNKTEVRDTPAELATKIPAATHQEFYIPLYRFPGADRAWFACVPQDSEKKALQEVDWADASTETRVYRIKVPLDA